MQIRHRPTCPREEAREPNTAPFEAADTLQHPIRHHRSALPLTSYPNEPTGYHLTDAIRLLPFTASSSRA